MNIGDQVSFKNGRYNNDTITVVGLAGDRIHVARKDQYGTEWRRYENAADLERLAISESKG